MGSDKKKLLLVDGHSILNRAFYGMPDLTNARGVHTGAVYGFLNILFSQLDDVKPDYLTVAFDVPAPPFRLSGMIFTWWQSSLIPDRGAAPTRRSFYFVTKLTGRIR